MRNCIISGKILIRILIVAFVGTTLISLVVIFQKEYKNTCKSQHEVTHSNDYLVRDVPGFRESITFILGEDREIDNPYYSEASNYYRFNEAGRTEYLVTECRSLLEVRNYLADNPPSNGSPWGLINLVSHGNQWLGLSIPVIPGSKRASVESIEEQIQQGSFIEVSDTLIDSCSEIYIHGCGIGKNKELLATITKAFGGTGEVPVVTASELFEYYTSTCYNGKVQQTQRLLANAWTINYKMGYRPDNVTICKSFNELYPTINIDWSEAVKRTAPRYTGDTYHYTFEVPVKWIIPFETEDSLPDVSTSEKQFEWLKNRTEINTILNRVNIPVENFNWWFRKVYVDDATGNRTPAIWVKGYSTILCVIQPITES